MITVISFIIVIGILIFVHEFGHFIVAKKTGVEVEKFSLGFGPKIIGFKKGETQYMISAIPLGGYVKMKGENPDEPLTNDPKEFSSRSVGVRFAIVAAGPITNFLLVFMLMPLVYYLGINVPAFLEQKPVVHWVAKNSPAKVADFKVGDRILTVDEDKVDNWEDYYELIIAKKPNKGITIEIERNGRIQEKILTINFNYANLNPTRIGLFHKQVSKVGDIFDGLPAQQAGLEPGDLIKRIADIKIIHWAQMSEVIREYPGEELILNIERKGESLTFKIKPAAIIDEIEKESPAHLAGLKAGDNILTINGKDVSYWKESLINKAFPKEGKFSFEVSREGKKLTATVIPQETKSIGVSISGRIGITPFAEEEILKKYGLLDSIKEGFKKTIDLTGKIFFFLKKLFTFELSMKQFGGPIMIAKMSGSAAKSGLPSFLLFIAFLSLNLSIINLFPIPVLDGGHLVFLLIELVMRRPLGAKKMEFVQKIGFALIILLMLTVTYNDILRFVPEKYLDFLPWK